MYRKLFSWALPIAGLVSAATLQQLSFSEMTQKSTAVVRARVVGSFAKESGSTIYTHYRVAVEETWKGKPVADVALPGGTVDGTSQTFPGVPTLKAGSEYVLFLWTAPSTGITHVMGLTQGLFDVTAQTDGSVTASRPATGELMLDASHHPVADHAVRMNIGEMKARVEGDKQ